MNYPAACGGVVHFKGDAPFPLIGCRIRSDMTTLTDIEGFLCRVGNLPLSNRSKEATVASHISEGSC
jgi:hypothetical protein